MSSRGNKSRLGALLLLCPSAAAIIAARLVKSGEWPAAVVAVAAACAACYLGSLLHLRARQRARVSAGAACEPDARPHVLYLRPFKCDESIFRAALGGAPGLDAKTEEEHAVAALQALGPVIAVGRPGEAVPALGANRVYFRDHEWQQGVEKLLTTARLIVLRVGETESWHWELRRALEMMSLDRIVLLFPPQMSRGERRRVYAPVRDRLREAGIRCPEEVGPDVLFLWLGGHGGALELNARGVSPSAGLSDLGLFTVRYLAALRPVFAAQGVQLPERLWPTWGELGRGAGREFLRSLAWTVGIVVVVLLGVVLTVRGCDDGSSPPYWPEKSQKSSWVPLPREPNGNAFQGARSPRISEPGR